MRGYTKDQLKAKGRKLSQYMLCDNCELYWHRRIFKKHLAAGGKSKPVYVISPGFADFLDWIAEAAVRAWMKDPDRLHMESDAHVPSRQPEPHDEVLTVDEAAKRFGVPRETILAELEKHKEEFSVTIPGASRKPSLGELESEREVARAIRRVGAWPKRAHYP